MPRVHYDAVTIAPSQAHETVFVSEWDYRAEKLPASQVASRVPSGGIMPAFTGHEIVFSDKWAHQQPDPIKVVAPVVPSGGVWPSFSGHEIVNVDKWFQRAPDFPTRHVGSVAPSGSQIPTFTGAEVVDVDKWQHQQPDPIRLVTPYAAMPSGNILPTFTGLEVVYPDKWFVRAADFPTRHVLATTPSGSQIPTFSGPEIIRLDKWFHQQPDPIRLALNLISLGGAFSPLSESPEAVTADRWLGYGPQPIKLALNLIALGGFSAPLSELPETVLADKWFGQRPDPIRAPLVFAPGWFGWGIQTPSGVVAPSAASWYGTRPAFLPLAQSAVLGGMFSVPNTAPEATSIDRWLGFTARQAASLATFRDTNAAPPILVVPSGWLGYWPQPTPQNTLAIGSSAFVPLVAPVGWQGYYPQIVAPQRSAHGLLSLVQLVASAPAPVMAWQGGWPQPFPPVQTMPWMIGAQTLYPFATVAAPGSGFLTLTDSTGFLILTA